MLNWLRMWLCPDTAKLMKRIETLEYDYAELTRVNQELELRVAFLSNALKENLGIILASDYTDSDTAIPINPAQFAVLRQYELTVADMGYYAYPKEQWVGLLAAIQPVVKTLIGKWAPEIADCDDFALVMNAYVVASFIKAGYNLQGAFFIAWSRTHAYNAFVDVDGGIWVYEPQNGRVIGRIKETTAPYDTRKAMFVGATV